MKDNKSKLNTQTPPEKEYTPVEKYRPFIIACAVCVVFILLYIAIESLDVLLPVRESFVYRNFVAFALSGTVLFFAWIARSRPPLWDRVTATAALLPIWVGFLFPYKFTVSAYCGAFLLLALRMAYTYVKSGDESKAKSKRARRQRWRTINVSPHMLMGAEFLFVWLRLRNSELNYGFPADDHGFPFLAVSALAAIAAACVLGVLIMKDKIRVKDDKTSYKCVAVIGVLLASFIWTTMLALNLNYSLDTHPKEEYSTVITDKYEYNRSKGSDTYYLEVVINTETIKVSVPYSEYKSLEVGDSVGVYRYQGAFFCPFYIYGTRIQ